MRIKDTSQMRKTNLIWVRSSDNLDMITRKDETLTRGVDETLTRGVVLMQQNFFAILMWKPSP